MTSSESAAQSAYAFEQFSGRGLVTSRLSGAGPGVLELAPVNDGEQARVNVLEAALAEGRAAGFAAAREEVAAATRALHEALAGVAALREQVADRGERDAVELSVALAEQIVAGALDVAPERVLDVVRGALRRITERNHVTILVNPADAELISAGLDTLRSELGGIEHGTVHADRRIERGGAIVQTVEGALDVQISSQFERVRAVAAEELARG